jgi:hypothetical protein
MAKIPYPDRGQPLDVTYIYQMASAINDISNEISSATYNYTSVQNPQTTEFNTIQTRAAKIVAGYYTVTTGEDVTGGQTKSFSMEYSGFKYPPIVTATAVNKGTSEIGDDVIVIIRSVTTSRVDGIVKFNKTGQATTTVNIMAVGIPT